ncbi:alpha/beta fold hydrolase [Paenibacillus thiaminolyticus]|uniref:Alpha/beta fold hydrolase n=1 Tax=Paenibacillus thiaminolyticus TaxID=49283 RepID=A0A3A3GMZ6_PANTH|nr:alpha/beta fold hydrolase [Paenibacillus thiaminolyticus]RJG26584.1 alpha/beta fold hydrolase [Paenibacillus thiaminolyticus]
MNLYLEQFGVNDAPLLVFLHGGGVSGWMWEKQLEYFKGRYHIVIPDLPGHGKSKDIPFHSICQTAQTIIQLIDMHREGRQVTVVGFSLGAQIALEMLGMREDVADHAVIVSGLAKPMKLGYSLLAPPSPHVVSAREEPIVRPAAGTAIADRAGTIRTILPGVAADEAGYIYGDDARKYVLSITARICP